MRRACDWLIDRHLDRAHRARRPRRAAPRRLPAPFLGTPPHAAVSATVDVAPGRARGFVNAVLRKVAAGDAAVARPGHRAELPGLDRRAPHRTTSGSTRRVAALEAMNRPPARPPGADGYTQDRRPVGRRAGRGRARRARRGPVRRAGRQGDRDRRAGGWSRSTPAAPRRARRGERGAHRLLKSRVAVADGRRPPFRRARVDRVLVDAPCCGLGVLRRRPDARWRITPTTSVDLAILQRELLLERRSSSAPAVVARVQRVHAHRGGDAGVDNWLASEHGA